jgi:serine/threonine protein kinase/tetratricopeptide (TPR) repeat protein
MTMSQGDRLGRYVVLGPLGQGGMGVVYRARDERLKRDVAIKVLPEQFANTQDRLARFEREARAVARLSHPNILEIHELGEHEGRPFMVTELLEGETLRERVAVGVLGWRKATEIGAAIADGLAAAHRAGIVHRDLKPSNVFLTSDGRVKLLDFGLARSVAVPDPDGSLSPTLTRHTEVGAVLGTVGYMAPEQVRGEPADHRSDVFALGCVLYEMLTAQPPFRRETAAETLTAILRDEHPEVSLSGVELLPEINRLVTRCLEKRPEQRFQSAADLAFALRSLGSGGTRTTAHVAADDTPPVDARSIAVLPFANLSPDPDNEYFSDGLTEEIIADLARVRAIRVISRTSSMRFKGADRDLRGIAADLGVRYVLEGSVRKAGNSLRITAQLIDATTDTHLWADKYTGTLDDVFELQEKISRRIVDALKVSLTADEDRRLASRPIQDPNVFDAWLRARQAGITMTRSGVAHGTQLIEHALARRGENALLLAALAWLRVLAYSYVPDTTDELFEGAESAARRALELQPDHPWALYAMGAVCHRRGDMQGFVRHVTRSAQIEENSHVLSAFGSYLGDAGRPELGRRYAERALAIDPLAWLSHYGLGYLDLVDGRGAAALDRMQAAADRFAPGESWSSFQVGHAAVHTGDDALATQHFRCAARGGDELYSELARLFLATLAGDRAGTLGQLKATALERLARRIGFTSVMVASCLAHIGETDRALSWLDHGVNWGFFNHRYLREFNPWLERLRGNPRFDEILGTAHRLGEQLEV